MSAHASRLWPEKSIPQCPKIYIPLRGPLIAVQEGDVLNTFPIGTTTPEMAKKMKFAFQIAFFELGVVEGSLSSKRFKKCLMLSATCFPSSSRFSLK